MIALNEINGILYIAMADPFDLDGIEEVRYMTGTDVKETIASKSSIDEAIEYCYKQKEDETTKYIQDLEVASHDNIVAFGDENEHDLLDHNSDSSVIKLLNMIIMEAFGESASDIHFEPIEIGLIVRYRVDGILQKKHTISRDMQTPITTRIKVLAKLDIAEHRLPQDGRLKLVIGGREIDFRISTIPVVFGERVVLRILDRSQVVLGLDKLGMSDSVLIGMRKFISKNQGIILVTGPTGSGKTTTLYAALSEIQSNAVNIMTIEDPVEFKLEGMAQIGVNLKIDLTFAKGLRHILRQDPDIIMIGEIRDKDTAEIAIQASLTGHLVFSTLHTNDAASAIVRLVDMGIEHYLLSSSLIGVLAQRLVRKICTNCKESYVPCASELKDLKMENQKDRSAILFYRGKGCKKCFNSGYKGRLGIYELMPVTTRIKSQILESADSNFLNQISVEQGMRTLLDDGRAKMLQGLTTTQEVLRVASILDEELV